MKSSKNQLLLFVIIFYVFSGCQTLNENDNEIDYIPGDVLISLEKGAQVTDVKLRIEELDLIWEEYFKHLNVAHIIVPIGEEKYWIKKLNEEPLIKNASLNRKVEYR